MTSQQCETLGCENSVSDGTRCDECIDATPTPNQIHARPTSWEDANFASPEDSERPDELLKREQWMGRVGKQPFAPWGDPDAPIPCTKDDHDADTVDQCGCDARWKWRHNGNYRDEEGVMEYLRANDEVPINGIAFIQQEDDPYAYIDGDDVRDPETGEVHPDFIAILDRLGLTYGDISRSGTGSHAQYRGELPEGVKQASWPLDDTPFKGNDDLPSIEIYARNRVYVSTGKHVPGTPTEVREWDAEALEEILDENDQLPIPESPHDFDLEDHKPTATTSSETADDIKDLFAAIDRLDARNVAEKTIVHRWNDTASTSSGNRAFYPVWGRDSNGTANIVDADIWQDTGDEGGWGTPVTMALIDLNEIDNTGSSPREQKGTLFWKGVDHLRDLGFEIPLYEPPSDYERFEQWDEEGEIPQPALRGYAIHHDFIGEDELVDGWRLPSGTYAAVLNELEEQCISHGRTPDVDSYTILADVSPTLDWQDVRYTSEIEKREARNRVQAAITDAIDSRTNSLIDALPSTGKSHGTVKVASTTPHDFTILVGRGREEMYDQYAQWADEYNLSSYRLPALTDCPVGGNEDHDQHDMFMAHYNLGAGVAEIHEHYGDKLACQEGCPYMTRWDFDPDNYDILIGHYVHAYLPPITTGRVVVLDEFPGDAYETMMPGSKHAESLASVVDGPITASDLKERRSDLWTKPDLRSRFMEPDGSCTVESDPSLAFDETDTDAPLVLATYLFAEDLGNGFEAASFDGKHTIFNRENESWHALIPPDLDYAHTVIGLDGTPTPAMWDLTTEAGFDHRQILDNSERRQYLTETLGHEYIQTTQYVKPHGKHGKYVNQNEDIALFNWIAEQHDPDPALITTQRAEKIYKRQDGFDFEVLHYGNLLGSNKFANRRVGVVSGSQHFGDGFIKKWGAFAGEPIKREGGKGADLSYTGIGDEILTHMREHQTLQAVLRFSRHGDGARVYVHTNTLPEWVEIQGQVSVRVLSDGHEEVITAVQDQDEEFAQRDLEIDISDRQTRRLLEDLVDQGYLERETRRGRYYYRVSGDPPNRGLVDYVSEI